MARIIYPDIYIREHREVIPSGSRNGKTIFRFKLMTSLRKERQGRWYLCNFTKSWDGFVRNDAIDYNEQIDMLAEFDSESCEVFSECGDSVE